MRDDLAYVRVETFENSVLVYVCAVGFVIFTEKPIHYIAGGNDCVTAYLHSVRFGVFVVLIAFFEVRMRHSVGSLSRFCFAYEQIISAGDYVEMLVKEVLTLRIGKCALRK